MLQRRLCFLVAVLALLAVVATPALALDKSADRLDRTDVPEDQVRTLDLGDLSNVSAAGGSCTAELDCGDGNVVSCEGTSTCRTTIAGVECDGNEVRCPNFCSVGVQCECGLRICWSTSGDCTQFPPTCNGFELKCFCPPTRG